MKKEKTTEQILIDYIKNVDSLQQNVIRSILVSEAQNIIADKETTRKQYEGSIISPDYVIFHAEKLLEEIGY